MTLCVCVHACRSLSPRSQCVFCGIDIRRVEAHDDAPRRDQDLKSGFICCCGAGFVGPGGRCAVRRVRSRLPLRVPALAASILMPRSQSIVCCTPALKPRTSDRSRVWSPGCPVAAAVLRASLCSTQEAFPPRARAAVSAGACSHLCGACWSSARRRVAVRAANRLRAHPPVRTRGRVRMKRLSRMRGARTRTRARSARAHPPVRTRARACMRARQTRGAKRVHLVRWARRVPGSGRVGRITASRRLCMASRASTAATLGTRAPCSGLSQSDSHPFQPFGLARGRAVFE